MKFKRCSGPCAASILILPRLFVAFVCSALTFQLLGLMELGIGGEIGKVKNSMKDSAERIKQELGLYLTGFSEPHVNFEASDRQHELRLLLDLVLGRFYGIEGGFWGIGLDKSGLSVTRLSSSHRLHPTVR
jgi:hypothetical protein